MRASRQKIILGSKTATILLLCGVALLPPVAVFAAPPGNVTGRVIASGGAPLPGATVTAASRSAVTDTSGNYTLWRVQDGVQTVTASKTGYVSASVSATVISKKTVTALTITLSPAAPSFGAVAGRVTTADSGGAISGASVVISGATMQRATDSDGNYFFDRVPAGTQTLSVSASGYQTGTETITVFGDTTTILHFSLSPDPAPPPDVSPPGSTIFWNGSAKYLLGANYPWWNYATEFGTGGWGKYTDWGAIDADFAAMQAAGVRVARWWVFGDGRYSPEFNEDGTVAGLDGSFLPDIDRALQIAANRRVYLVFSVVDNIIWDPASYANGVQLGGRQGLITDPEIQQTFLDNALKPLLQRVAASPYRNMVMAYDIVSEPEAQMRGYWGGVGLEPSAVQVFVRRAAAYIHTHGGGAYATVDSAMPAYAAVWKNLGLDFYQFHYYPWMDFGGSPGSGLPAYASLMPDKPAVVSEFPTANNSYQIGDIAPLTSQWYVDTIYTYGYAGTLGWSYRAGDSVSNWGAFRPVFSAWAQRYAAHIGPQ